MNARRRDTLSSHMAGDRIRRKGPLKGTARFVLSALEEYPGEDAPTSRQVYEFEVARARGAGRDPLFDRAEAHRRLVHPLEKLGYVRPLISREEMKDRGLTEQIRWVRIWEKPL